MQNRLVEYSSRAYELTLKVSTPIVRHSICPNLSRDHCHCIYACYCGIARLNVTTLVNVKSQTNYGQTTIPSISSTVNGPSFDYGVSKNLAACYSPFSTFTVIIEEFNSFFNVSLTRTP
jgi:hypothetical protein